MSENEENLLPEEKQGSSVSQKVDSARSNTKKLKDFFSKFNKSKAGSRTLVKALAKILVSAGWVILAFIIIVGIIMFFLTMPGMVMEKLKGLFKAIANGWNAWWGEDSATQFEKCQIYNVLNYLDEMGYDLKGYGFVTEFLTNPNTEYDRGGAESEPEEKKSTKDGVIRDENNKVITGVSEFINTYLISENYMYTIKNFNVDTDTGWEAFWNHVGALFSATNSLSGRSGMLVFYHDTGNVGERDGAYGASERGYIKFDTESKKLVIKKGWTNGAMEYSLDGWTGRYGMPVDFLLTVHLATQMPDLAYDMATTFDTEINLLLHSSEGTIYGSYKTESGEYVTYEKLDQAFGRSGNTGFLADILSNIDGWHISGEEAKNAHDLGIHPPGCSCVESTTYKYTDADGVSYVLYEEKDDTETVTGYYYNKWVGLFSPQEKVEVALDDEGIDFSSAETNIKTACDNCKDYLKYILKRMRKASDDSYKTYTPYIESVQNHWFRDVYFVEKDTNDAGEAVGGFVDYDYQYELITGERWTLYETDDNGDFVYYVMNEDGSTSNEIYTGKVISGEFAVTDSDGNVQTDSDGNIVTERLANRGEDGTLVVKKAKLVEDLEDLGWNESDWGSMIAYDPEIQNPTPTYDPMYSEDEIAGGKDDLEKDAMKHMYIEIAITNVTQTGEGLRTETNPKIKKMFMSNNYFKYDGSRQRAEIIYALRKASGVEYGPIDDDMLDKTYPLTFPKVEDGGKFTSEAEEGEYKLGDYVGNVSFQQDALNTFAMLENSHTIDADYIYKDFKELIVELGYFEKEELTESKPKLLQWLIPDIGSAGYPERSIDKREAEYGTMIHSKMDIDANKKNLLVEMYKNAAKDRENDPFDMRAEQGSTEINTDSVSGIELNGDLSNVNNSVGSLSQGIAVADVERIVGAMGGNFERILEEGDGYKSKVKTGNVEYTHYYQLICGGGSYADKKFYWSGAEKTIDAAGCGPTSCINILTGYGYDVNPTNDIIGIHFDATIGGVKNFMEEKGVPGQSYSGLSKNEYITLIEEAFAEGRPIITLMGNQTVNGRANFWTTGGHFVAIAGQDTNGNIITVDPASVGRPDRETFEGGVENLVIALSSVWIADEAPDGVSRGGNPYEGYKGNEAVVSPVTGILMEYGTYDAESAQENRENIDLKYGGLLEGKEYNTQEVTETDPETGETTTTTEILYPYDKVGYAVIKVLDAETYKKLETTVDNKWKDDSLVEINERSVNYDSREYVDVNKHISFKERTDELVDEDRDWTPIEETVYGYKEFVEQYEQFGIGGYYIYIDGFKCETVGETPEGTDESDSEDDNESEGSFIPTPGDPLTKDSFKVDPGSIGEETSDDDIGLESLYEPDEVSKLVSKEYSEKLKAESAIKSDASVGITFSYEDLEPQEDGTSTTVTNEYILIKEGTVIGRTYTDKELLEEREGNYGTYEEYVEAQEAAISIDDETIEQPVQLDGEQAEDPDKFKINAVPLAGNYLRIIMQETNGDIVENVEDYMKIDEMGQAELDNDILIRFIDSHEGGALYDYLYADGSYTGSVPQLVTEDKQYFICYKDGVNGNDDRNYGFGILHWLDESYHSVENYAQVGVTINDGSHLEVGVSQCPVDKVLEVQKMIIEQKRELVISQIGQSNYDKLTKQQQDCLVDIAYQGCSTWGELKSLLDAGATPQQVVDGWGRLTSTASNNQERADARKKLWLEGIYTDSSGNEIK